ncbi:MAG: NADH-quinone oxidoreductase subunit L, partial [Thermodesulfovibrionales bacterium]
QVLFIIGAFTALLTAFYSFRIIYVAFHGSFRGTHEQEHHLHESPKVMTIPLIILAIGAIASGWVGVPPLLGEMVGLEHTDRFGDFLAPVFGGHHPAEGSHLEEINVMGLSIAAGIIGILISAALYLRKTDLPEKLGERFSGIYKILWNKYYVDELYDFIIVRPTLWIANRIIVAVTDGKIIEGIVNGVPATIGRFSSWLRGVQTGLVHQYATIMAIGAFIIVVIALLWR